MVSRPAEAGPARIPGDRVDVAEVPPPQGLTVRDHAMTDFRRYIHDVPDFPSPGILFRDVTPLLASPDASPPRSRAMAEPFRAIPPRRSSESRRAGSSSARPSPGSSTSGSCRPASPEAPAQDRARRLRPRVRQGQPRGPRRRVYAGRARAGRRRRARHGRHGRGRPPSSRRSSARGSWASPCSSSSSPSAAGALGGRPLHAVLVL